MQIIIGQTHLGEDFQSQFNEIKLLGDRGLISRETFFEIITISELSSFSNYFPEITDVTIGHCNLLNIDFFEYFPNVRSVSFKTSFLKNISGLPHLHKIRKLSIERPKYRFDVLGLLHSLEELYLDDWRSGADSIFSLANLKKIGVQKFGKENLNDTVNWSSIKEMWFNAGNLQSLEGIPANVEKLRLTSLRKLKSLIGLLQSKNLKDLRIEGCKSINSLKGIENCTNLRVLSLARLGSLETLEPLLPLKNLEYLVIADGTTIGIPNINVLNGLPNLTRMIISKTSGITSKQMYTANPRCEVNVVN